MARQIETDDDDATYDLAGLQTEHPEGYAAVVARWATAYPLLHANWPDKSREKMHKQWGDLAFYSNGDEDGSASADDAEKYRAAARAQYADGSNNDIEIDADAIVSESDEGAFVAAWVWVGKAEAFPDADDTSEDAKDDAEEAKNAAAPSPDPSPDPEEGLADKLVEILKPHKDPGGQYATDSTIRHAVSEALLRLGLDGMGGCLLCCS